jgi:L-rhamnose mutarotase
LELQITQRFGSLIGLRPEYEERYIILHKHTFPGVLERIYDSCIRNYSIFLRKGILFSYYEYIGQDYEEDMWKIGEDATTQEWWKLTDPMQEPIKTRKEGERWSAMEEIVQFSGTNTPVARAQRFACVTEKDSIRLKDVIFIQNVLTAAHIYKLSVFHNEGRLYLYSEFSSTTSPSEVENTGDRIDHLFSQISLGEQTIQWKSMREVFHTD